MQQHFWWASMTKDVRTFVVVCSMCARNKLCHRPPAGLLQPLPVTSHPWSHVTIDLVTGLPPSEGNTTILTIIDRFSKAVHFVPLPKLPTALEATNLLVKHVFRLHGIPKDLVSDCRPQFTSHIWKVFCQALGATVSLTLGYHPQSNGQTERVNQSLESALRCVASHLPSSWATHLPWVEYAHNSLISSATGLSPFLINNGFQPPLFSSQESIVTVPSVQAQFCRVRQVWQETRAVLGRTTWVNKFGCPLQTSTSRLNPKKSSPDTLELSL